MTDDTETVTEMYNDILEALNLTPNPIPQVIFDKTIAKTRQLTTDTSATPDRTHEETASWVANAFHRANKPAKHITTAIARYRADWDNAETNRVLAMRLKSAEAQLETERAKHADENQRIGVDMIHQQLKEVQMLEELAKRRQKALKTIAKTKNESDTETDTDSDAENTTVRTFEDLRVLLNPKRWPKILEKERNGCSLQDLESALHRHYVAAIPPFKRKESLLAQNVVAMLLCYYKPEPWTHHATLQAGVDILEAN
eukprot:PhM_4_TR18096/c2_g1_i1/m.49134